MRMLTATIDRRASLETMTCQYLKGCHAADEICLLNANKFFVATKIRMERN